MKCLHFSLLWKSPTFLVEIRGGAISKGNGEGDSLRGLLQEFLLTFYFSFSFGKNQFIPVISILTFARFNFEFFVFLS